MRKLRTPIALLVAVILSLALAHASFASRADTLLRDAAKAVDRAESAKSRADKDEYYKKALSDYGEVAGKYKSTAPVQAARALYESAVVQRDMAESYVKPGDKHNSLYQSYQTSRQVVNRYDLPEKKLAETYNLEDAEVRQVQDIVARARSLKEANGNELDKMNSKDIKYKILDFLVHMTGAKAGFSYWFAIVLITVIVKLAITPLTKAQFKSMKEMQKVAPLLKEVQEKHKGDQKTIGEKTMEIYKQHNINPFASCLPLLVQMPILMLLYYTIRSYEFQFAHGTFLWIGSGLSHLWSVAPPAFGGPGDLVWVTARNLSEPDLLLVLLYVISMYVSTKLSAVDPTQAEQQKMMAIMMPVMFAFIFASFPSAFLLYWLVFNILQTAQQYFILRSGREDGGGEAVIAAPPTAPAPTEPTEEGDTTRVRRRRRR